MTYAEGVGMTPVGKGKFDQTARSIMTATQVAHWMMQEIERVTFLYHTTAVQYIGENFGKQFVYTNRNGNPAISTEVLKEFGKLKPGRAEWDRSERRWLTRASWEKYIRGE